MDDDIQTATQEKRSKKGELFNYVPPPMAGMPTTPNPYGAYGMMPPPMPMPGQPINQIPNPFLMQQYMQQMGGMPGMPGMN